MTVDSTCSHTGKIQSLFETRLRLETFSYVLFPTWNMKSAVLLCVCLFVRLQILFLMYMYKKQTNMSLCLGINRKSSTLTHRPIMMWSSSITETLTSNSLKAVSPLRNITSGKSTLATSCFLTSEKEIQNGVFCDFFKNIFMKFSTFYHAIICELSCKNNCSNLRAFKMCSVLPLRPPINLTFSRYYLHSVLC